MKARRLVGLIAVLTVVASIFPGATARAQTSDYTQYVDPFIGTFPPGMMSPGPAAPYGMVGLGPDTEGPINYGGYYYINNTITGFSHIHMSAGVPRGGQIPMMPVTGDVMLGDEIQQAGGSPVPRYSSPFDHATEVAEVGYYKAELRRYATTAELTTTTRAGVHRYTFPAGLPASVVIDPSRDLKGYNSDASVKVDGDYLTGHVTAERGIKVYFAAAFSKPFTVRTFQGTTISGAQEASGSKSGAIVDFGSEGGQVISKVGISFVDVDGAKNNVESEVPDFDFDAVRAANVAAWNEALSTIEVESVNVADLTSFYTALYHAQLFPNIFSDVDGRYIGFDDEIRTSNFTRYTQFSLWDSYRGQNQLLSVINPEAYRDMTLSLLDMYKEGGILPRWTFANRDPSHMSGDPVIPFIGEGWCRGVLDDVPPGHTRQLLDAMKHKQIQRNPDYAAKGYLPVEKPSNSWFGALTGGPGSTGTTLEYGIADFSLALMEDQAEGAASGASLTGATNYRNILDPETKWVRPRHADGTWLEEFLPENGYGFQEGTSWQYSWLAMQDLAGLMERMEGADLSVEDRLDVFFNLPATATTPVVWPKLQYEVTVFGIEYYGNQYVPGNEHDLQGPYLYNYAGVPWKTQAAQRGAVSLFTPTPDGLPGNDDLGALSGWLVWSMLGIYPQTPGAPIYTVASPVFDKATVHMADGDLVINAPGTTFASKYLQSVNLDGAPLTQTWFDHGAIRDGATLDFTMGPVPNLTWGTGPDDAPPSLSTHDLDAFGCEAAIDFRPGEGELE